MEKRPNIIVAPLNWGLGHATRCIPIINELNTKNYNVTIASDGNALHLLRKEFPKLKCIELPGYNISYTENKNLLKLKLLVDTPVILKSIKREQKLISDYIENNSVAGIISDNRFGVYHKNVPSVLITHQLKVLSGYTTWISSKINKNFIERFDECWIPDYNSNANLSGIMSTNKNVKINSKFIGTQSRFRKQSVEKTIDILCLLSGPEPQRSLLEKKLIANLRNVNRKIVLICGVVENKQTLKQFENILIYNFMTSKDLENTLNKSKSIICRSGYSSLMDLFTLGKRAFFIPTPGQYEQQYLAERMEDLRIAPYCQQDEFNADKLDNISDYNGFIYKKSSTDFDELFGLFKRK